METLKRTESWPIKKVCIAGACVLSVLILGCIAWAQIIDDHPQLGGWITYVDSDISGHIAVHIRQPAIPRYASGAPVIVNVSGFFTSSSGFDYQFDPDAVGVMVITYLWPGKIDVRTGVSSQGLFDYGGEDCLAALRDVIRFATGGIPDVDGQYLHEITGVAPLYDVSGLYAFSHSGIAATNVLARHGSDLQRVRFFVGRENPTVDTTFPLEPGYWGDDGRAVFNPYYNPAGYTPTSIDIDYSTVYWAEDVGRPAFAVAQGPDFVCSFKHPTMFGRDYWSEDLLQALLDNGALTRDTWPDTLATPEDAAENWPSRTTASSYPLLADTLPDLKVMLVFASDDHVQVAIDKPHIHQAYDGFRFGAGLWCRLNPDRSYVEAFLEHDDLVNLPDNRANAEPSTWAAIRMWGYRTPPASLNKFVPLAAIAEMCDRTVHDNWIANLDAVLSHALTVSDARSDSMTVTLPDGTSIIGSPLTARLEDNPDRDFGLYMDPSWAPTWDAELIDWPDFGLPTDSKAAARQIITAYQRAKSGERLEIGCIGGLGRTGTVLACLAILAGVPADESVEWVRANYNAHAVETQEQEDWVLWFGQFAQTLS